MSVINIESPAVHSYLNILQGIIGRMAANSSACKTWCITLVSAIIVVTATTTTPDCIWIALVPAVLFLLLDAYYLALERCFRDRYNDFAKTAQKGTVSAESTFIVMPISSLRQLASFVTEAARSFSIWPFYGMLLVTLLMARYGILR